VLVGLVSGVTSPVALDFRPHLIEAGKLELQINLLKLTDRIADEVFVSQLVKTVWWD
jgi:hypothetical protein